MEDAAHDLGVAIGQSLFLIVFIIGSTVFVLLIIRYIVCWYFKINEIAASLKERASTQRDLLKGLDAINENLISVREQLTPDTEAPADLDDAPPAPKITTVM